MQFLLTIIELILKDSSHTKKYVQQKIKFAFGDKLNNEQALEIFSDCAETPESLDIYLKDVVVGC